MSSVFDRLCSAFRKKPSFREPFLKRTVIAIDDDVGQLKLIKTVLEKKGMTVVTAEAGDQGLALVRSHPPDLILLDVNMPAMDGREVCRQLKADEKTKDIPVLFLTSADTPNDIVEHYELGAEIHLTKPIDSKELLSQVETILKDIA